MQVKKITEKKEWNEFIDRVKPSSFLHAWEWGEFEKSLGRPVIRFGVYDNNNLVAASLWSKVSARRGKFMLCPHGPIVAPEAENKLQEIIECIKEEIVDFAKREQCDFVRVSTLSLDTPEHRDIFKKAGFRNAPIHVHSELAWILDVTLDEEILLKGMKKNTRYSIRKAEKDGVTVRKSESLDDFETFWNIYMTTAERQKFTPYSKEYLRKEFELFLAEKKAVLFFGEYQGTAISTAFVVYANGSGFYHHGASNQKFPSVTASELVQWEAIKEAKARGCLAYNFWGIVPEEAVKHPWHGLSKFKRGFGGYGEAYVHAQDFSLTPKYWINYIVEKFRKIRRHL